MVILFSFWNNTLGGDFIDILSLWKIGKFLKDKEKSCFNVHKICSDYFSYYYGNSYQFSLVHIQMMEKLYYYFPIYCEKMKNIHWNSYLELLKLSKRECYFYYYILLFCGDDYFELKQLICNDLYSRI